MHLFDQTFDHDFYFELPRKGERDTQSIARCFTSHHGDFRALPRANRTFSTAPTPSAHRLPDASANAVHQDTSLLPVRWPRLTRQSSESVGRATPTDRAVAGSPTELIETTPVARVPHLATIASCNAVLRSALPPATGS